MYTGLKNFENLPTALALHAWHLRRCARSEYGDTDAAYEMTYRATYALSQDIKNLKPSRIRRKIGAKFGRPTLGALAEKHLGPVMDLLTAQAYGDEEVQHYLWPDEVTLESYQTFSKATKFRGSGLGGSEGDAIALIGDAIWNIALALQPSIDYSKPTLCRICYRHTDPKSQSIHCLKHARTNHKKPTAAYKRGQTVMASALAVIGEPNYQERLREFVAKMKEACHRPDTAQFLKVVQQHCPEVWAKFGEPENCEQSFFDTVRQLGHKLEDLYATNWVDAMERRYQRILPEKFDPSKCQVIDPEEIDVRMARLRAEVTDHLCLWIAGAEIFLKAEQLPPRVKGRPRREDSRSAAVGRLLLEGSLSRQEIAKKAEVSIGLVHQIARKIKDKI